MRLRAMWIVAGLLLGVPVQARADVKPHALCSEGMVLQQKSEVRVWGTANKGEAVTVTFRNQKVATKADGQGNWVVMLKSGEAGGPFDMTIAGKNTIAYKNVLVGEVWVCSGQSNMEWSVGGCDKADKDYAFSAPHNPMLRLFRVQMTPSPWPVTNTTGSWTEADPKTIGGWTAAGYYFGRDLQEKLKVPVGLIQSAWGGTRAEAWTTGKTLLNNPAYSAEFHNWQNQLTLTPDGKAMHPNAPAVLYNGMIHPILNYRIQGAIWYQGESNAGQAYAYRTLFPMMIDDWRKQWKQPDFPFYFVQLAPFTSIRKDPNSSWAELREAQLMTLKLRNTGMAVITDYGNEYDIHPTPKRPVGERLALIARAKTYGEKVEYSGPEYTGMKIEGNKAVLTFDHTDGGLVAHEMVPTLERKDPKTGQVTAAWRVKDGSERAPVVGFTIAGQDKVFHPAKAEIAGKTVVVSSDAVPEPVAVRYGWADHPLCNLFNRASLPASPFRTDEFPASTAPKQ